MIGVLVGLAPLAVITLAIVALVRARRHPADDRTEDGGVGTVRRLFLYGVGLVALVFAGIGLSLLIGGGLDAIGGETVIAESDTQLAVALSFSIVGIPAWLLTATLAQRSVSRAPAAESASELRRWYLNLARAIALALVVVQGISAARFVLGVADFEGDPWGWTIVWAGVWLLHDLVVRNETPSARTREVDHLYLAFASVFGLSFMVSGISAALNITASAAYDAAFRPTVVGIDWSADLREALAVAAIGAGVWALHWLIRLKPRPPHDSARQIVVFLFGVLPGVALALIPAATGMYGILDWWIGNPTAPTAADHFAHLPSISSMAVLGVAAWLYFRAVIAEDQRTGLVTGEPERVYRYLVSAAGLSVTVVGLIAGLALAVEAIAPEPARLVRSDDWWRDPFVLTLTLLIVGLPVWAVYWTGVQRAVARNPLERTVLSRRVYLFAIFGASSIASIVSLTIILFNFFDALLGDGLTSAVLIDGRWAIGIVLTAGIVATYHWSVLREDQPAGAGAPAHAERRPARDLVILTPLEADPLVSALRDIEGVRVHVWRRVPFEDGASQLAPERIAAARAAVEGADESCLLIVSESGDIELQRFEAPRRLPLHRDD